MFVKLDNIYFIANVDKHFRFNVEVIPAQGGHIALIYPVSLMSSGVSTIYYSKTPPIQSANPLGPVQMVGLTGWSD